MDHPPLMSASTLPAVYALRYGTLEPLPERLSLVAGPLSCEFEAGELRSIRCGDEILLSRLYAAVRDRHWGTVPGRIHVREQTVFNEGFRLVFEAVHEQTLPSDTIHFVWTGRIEGKAGGVITFEFEGEAKTTFWRNRIGFCLLHPAERAGHPVTVEHTDQGREEAHLPGLVDPAQPVLPFSRLRALAFGTGAGETVEIRMEGDAFEMEDQRNWTDASFKTFCTPLALPYPVEVVAGARIKQKVTVQVVSPAKPRAVSEAAIPSRTRSIPPIVLRPDDPGYLPAIGVGHHRPYPRRSLIAREEKHLRVLGLAHMRVDIRFGQEDWRKNFAYVAATARQCGIPLAIALYLPRDAEKQAEGLRALLWDVRQADTPIGRWQIYAESEKYDGQTWPAIPYEQLRVIAPDATILSGSDSDFIFFNRLQGPAPEVSGIAFQINPQVHAFDNDSVMETPLVYEAVVETARFQAKNTSVHISPLTLKPRYNPYARGESAPPIPPDPRQKALFTAAWVVHCLAALTAARVESVTLFDAIGDTGMVKGDGVYPVWIPLGWLAPLAGASAIPFVASDPRKVAGLRVGAITLVANLTDQVQTVVLPASGAVSHVRTLDERSVVAACDDPERFLVLAGEHRSSHQGEITLKLLPYAVCCVREP